MSLVAYYPLDGDADDESPAHNHGRVFGATPYIDRHGVLGHALRFDGVDDYVSIDNGIGVDFGVQSPMTIAVWLLFDSPSVLQHIFGKRPQCADTSYQLAIDDRGLHFGGNSLILAYQNPLPRGQWVHVTITFDGSSCILYRDGQQVALGSGTLGPSLQAPLKLGTSGDCAGFFAGAMDDLIIFNRALSATVVPYLRVAAPSP